MPCDSVKLTLTDEQKLNRERALARLEQSLQSGAVSVVVGQLGGVAFRGWKETDRAGLADLCAYRRLSAGNSSALRSAVARAEAVAGRRMNPQAIGGGLHSHDEGQTWGRG